ncbi:MAG: hypothetical protein COA79_21450 [Planctomycetota bacterium]|nr:MAG: hypothetical protein COA79_21450 [Planctomycetota bacterium]
MKTEHFVNRPDRNIDTGILCIANQGVFYQGRVLHASFSNIPRVGPLKNNYHKHDVYHFVFINEGVGHAILENDILDVSAGWLLITSPGQAHDFSNIPGESKKYSEVTFEFLNEEGEALTIPFYKLLENWTGRSCRKLDRGLVKPELQHLILEKIQFLVMTGKNQKFGFSLDIVSVLSEIFRDLYIHLFTNDDRSKLKEPIVDIHDFLHKKFQKKLGLEELSKLTGLSKNYISRKFKENYGKTPINYLHQIRIEAAKNLLKNTEYPIKQVGEIVGFDDIYFFSKVFKKLSKLPPGKFRKNYR